MIHKINMTIPQLKQFMGAAFNLDMYERGRADVRAQYTEQSRERLIARATDFLTNQDQIDSDFSSYWIGQFRELEFLESEFQE